MENDGSTGALPSSGYLRFFIWVAVGCQVLLMAGVAGLQIQTAPYSHSTQNSLPGALVGVLAILIYPAIGSLIFSRRPAHPVGWLFCLSQVGWTLNNFAQAFGLYALRARPDLLPTARWLAWFYVWPGNFSTVLTLFLILLFPDGRLPSPHWKPVAWLIVGFGAVSMLAGAFAPGPVDTSGVLSFDNPLGVGGMLGGALVILSNWTQAFFIALVAVVAVALIGRFRSARGQTRQQLKWLAFAIVLIVLLWAQALVWMMRYPTAAATPFWAQALEQLSIFSMVLIPVSAGIAVLRYRLYEIDRIINQALVYFSLTAALALVYFGLVFVLQALLNLLTGEGRSSITTVLSTLAIAGLFTPLRRRIQQVIDRRFYRKRYNAERILDRLSGVLRSEVDLQIMSDQLVAMVEETFQPSQAALWIKKKT